MITTNYLIFILIAVAIMFLHVYHNGNVEYRLYKDAFTAYQRAEQEGKSFYQFSQDYINGKDISKATREERVTIQSLQRLFTQCPNLAKEYFVKEKFRYSIEFSELKSKWHAYDHLEQEELDRKRSEQDKPEREKAQIENTRTLGDLLICEDALKDSLIKKIGSYLYADNKKGKSMALLISALREKKYISSWGNATIVKHLEAQFGITIPRGYNEYLSERNFAKTLEVKEINCVKNQINIDDEK